MAGYDWIVSNLLPKRAFTRPGRSERVGRIVVCGELAGAQLATTLALTECRVGEPGVVAANVNMPIIDWTELDEMRDTSTASAGLSSNGLLKQRSALFRKPQDYYDSFSSPGLFFRSASSEVPGEIEASPADELVELASLERMDFFREQNTLENVTAQQDETQAIHGIRHELVKRRKASRRFPSKALRLRLPQFRISTGTESPLLDQSMELAHVLRQSFERQAKSGELTQEDMAGRYAQYVEKPGLGLWDSSKIGQASMLESARWMARAIVAKQEDAQEP
jgi:acetyl esterase/lipase